MLNETLCNNNAKLFTVFLKKKMPTFRYSINIVTLIRDQKFTVATVFLRVITDTVRNTEKQQRRKKNKLFEKHNIRKGNET